MKIKIPAVSLELQTPVTVNHYFIELNDDNFIFSYDMITKEPINVDDPGMGWTEKDSVCETLIIKRRIGGVEIWRVDWEEEERWGFVILLEGLNDVKMYFKSKDEAFEMRKKFLEWWRK